MWSALNSPASAGKIRAIGGPRCGTNCNTPASTAHNGAHGTRRISNPINHISATATDSQHWATNQFFSAEPAVWICSRNSIERPVNHRGHGGTQRKSGSYVTHGNQRETVYGNLARKLSSQYLCDTSCPLWLKSRVDIIEILPVTTEKRSTHFRLPHSQPALHLLRYTPASAFPLCSFVSSVVKFPSPAFKIKT